MAEIKLWKDKEKELVDPYLFSKIAEDTAKEIAGESRERRGINKRTQLRKFYDEVLRLDSEAKTRPDKWEITILPRLHMMTAKIAYAEGRQLISKNFADLINRSVDQISSIKDLKVFTNFFEAFMGFYRKYGPRD